MIKPEDHYTPLTPANYLDAGLCFYCGCESDLDDYVPPIIDLEVSLKITITQIYVAVPCCDECSIFLEDCIAASIEDRKSHVNNAISKKYLKALTIYKRWDENEINDLDSSFATSIKAGIKLGREVQQRLRYPGYKHELDDDVAIVKQIDEQSFSVFGEVFNNFDHALKYAARSYKINIVVLEAWLSDYDYNFDAAITAHFSRKEQELFRKKKDRLCRDFAERFGKDINWVKTKLDINLASYPDDSMEICLQMILEDYLS